MMSSLCTAILLVAAVSGFSEELPEDETTITSDHMELIDHGKKTVFEGNVTIQKKTYELKANRMSRLREDGMIEAEGRIRATWNSEEGQQVIVRGDRGRYDPNTEVAELWTKPSGKVTVDWKDTKGSARFFSERAEFRAAERKVRLVNRVTGHIIPTPQ
jgi:lipopolysaccharide export system protein LptA